MSRKNKSKNNRRCTQGKFTENPKQYLLFCDRTKYDHIIDRGLISVINRSGETKAIFNYEEVKKLYFISRSVTQHKSIV